MKNLYEYSVKRQYVCRISEEQVYYRIGSPNDADEVIKKTGIHQDEQENFLVLFLDTRNKIKGFHKVTRGLCDRSHVHPREVFRAAIIQGCSKIICVHNHPTGETTPSRQDIDTTENLVKSGELIGIKVVDHIIVGEKAGQYKSYSMKIKGDM